jgi:methylisocitrate lyase
MLFARLDAREKRVNFRKALATGKLLQFPGAISPLAALEIQRQGFDGVYISGAVLSADLGLPDIGLTTLTEVSGRAEQMARVVDLPAIVDADTGFGEPMSVARTIRMLEERGLAGTHLEDQVNPKRCGHLDNKTLVTRDDMVRKLKAAIGARRDKNFLIIARTDARGVEGLDGAIARAKAYADAGADMIFPEALADEKEFAAMRKAVSVPLLANMTEFGKSRLLTKTELSDLGYNIVIYPVTLLRLAMGAVIDGLKAIKSSGSQESVVPKMQTRADLYELLRYKDYETFDSDIFNFRL